MGVPIIDPLMITAPKPPRKIQVVGTMILETAVGRPPGGVPRGGWQGTTRRNSDSIPTSCNAARRRAGRALVDVAAFTR